MKTAIKPTFAGISDPKLANAVAWSSRRIIIGTPRTDGLSFIIDGQEALEDALSAIFDAAKPEHGLKNAGFLAYVSHINNSHIATFADECDMYTAVFTEQGDLQVIVLTSTYDTVWQHKDWMPAIGGPVTAPNIIWVGDC